MNECNSRVINVEVNEDCFHFACLLKEVQGTDMLILIGQVYLPFGFISISI